MNRGLHRLAAAALAALVVCGPTASRAEQAALTTETSLRPAPEAATIFALLTPGTPVEVLDSREGWVRVRVEGWVRATALPGAPAEPPLASADHRPAAPVTAPPAVTTAPPAAPPFTGGVPVEGTIHLKLGRLKKLKTAGTEVLLVPAAAGIGVVAIDQDTRKQFAELDAEVERIDREIDKAMHMDNFTKAVQKRDELTREREAIFERRLSLLAPIHGRRQQAARRAAVAAAIADSRGFFTLPATAPGEYTLYARLTSDDLDVEWIESLAVGAVRVKVNLDAENARGLPTRAE